VTRHLREQTIYLVLPQALGACMKHLLPRAPLAGGLDYILHLFLLEADERLVVELHPSADTVSAIH
jgi:hypothetical protein